MGQPPPTKKTKGSHMGPEESEREATRSRRAVKVQEGADSATGDHVGDERLHGKMFGILYMTRKRASWYTFGFEAMHGWNAGAVLEPWTSRKQASQTSFDERCVKG